MKRNATKFSLKIFLIALSATVLLTACGKPEESNDSQPSDASAAVSDTAVSGTASDAASEFSDDLTSDTTTDTSSGIDIDTIFGEKAQSVNLGGHHGAAITEDGNLYLWGANEYGQLGIGINSDRDMPVKVMKNVKAVSLGKNHTISDSAHSAAITEDGDLYLWGANEFGKLGIGTEGLDVDNNTPIRVMEGVKAVSLGADHSAALTVDGSLYLWGSNKYGQLGNGTTVDSSEPIKIMDHVVSVSLGSYHSAAVTEDGSLYLWGCNLFGQLGNGTEEDLGTPTKIMDHVVSVSLGDENSAAVTEDGSLYLWGLKGYARFGVEEHVSTPVKTNLIPKT